MNESFNICIVKLIRESYVANLITFCVKLPGWLKPQIPEMRLIL